MLGFLSSIVPAAVAMLALPFGLRSRVEEKNVRAVYLFHRSGDPLVTVASEYVLPIESTHLEPVLGAGRDFVDSPDPAGRGIQQTTRRFGQEGGGRDRGRFGSAGRVDRGPA